MKKAKFVTFSGGEGSGKSSQIERMKKAFPDVLFTFEPGGSEFGIKARELLLGPLGKTASPFSQMTLTFSGSNDHLAKLVVPALKQGQSVVSDRICTVCSYAYQVFGEEGQDLIDLFLLLREKNYEVVAPDVSIIFDVDPAEGMRRVAKRKAAKGVLNHFDARGIEFHERIRAGYLDYAKRFPETTVVIDANPSEEVVWQSLEKVLREHGFCE